MSKKNRQNAAASPTRHHRESPANPFKKPSPSTMLFTQGKPAIAAENMLLNDIPPASSPTIASPSNRAKPSAENVDAALQAVSFDASINLDGVLTLMIAGNTIRLPCAQTRLLARMLQTVAE